MVSSMPIATAGLTCFWMLGHGHRHQANSGPCLFGQSRVEARPLGGGCLLSASRWRVLCAAVIIVSVIASFGIRTSVSTRQPRRKAVSFSASFVAVLALSVPMV
jgi:hypothetical protein